MAAQRDIDALRSDGFNVAHAHARRAEDVLRELEAVREGLHSSDAVARLRRHGRNTLPVPPPTSIFRVVARQFASPLIYILLVAAAVSAAIGDFKDAAFILAVLVLNATIGAFQESRAERSAEALRSLVTARAHVLRNGEECEIAAEEVVPGDIAVVESGVKIPADLRLVSGSLEIDESLLTGESVPAVKHADAASAEDAPLGDRVTMAFAGTMVTRGRGYGVVVATGIATELGKIATSLTSTKSAKPPLLQRMERFTRKIALAVAVAIVLLGALMLFRGASLYSVFS